jgi:hypothetical protein
MKDSSNRQKCIDPGMVRDSDIPKYAEGSPRAEFATHLTNCAFCQNELVIYHKLAIEGVPKLSAGTENYRKDCPDTDQITDYVASLLSGANQREIKNHLATCPYCWSEYMLLKAEYSEGVSELEPLNQNLGTRLKRWLATLLNPLPQLAVRGETKAVRDLHFTAGDYSLLLNLSSEGNSFRIAGAIARNSGELEEFNGVEVTLKADGELIKVTLFDEDGQFLLEQIERREDVDLSLEIALADGIIEVADLPKV